MESNRQAPEIKTWTTWGAISLSTPVLLLSNQDYKSHFSLTLVFLNLLQLTLNPIVQSNVHLTDLKPGWQFLRA